jgi:DHA3 family macrolide efflux protein-like MFS transporter
MPLSMLVFGPMADYVRIEWMLLISGLVMIAMSVILKNHKVLVQAGEPTVG